MKNVINHKRQFQAIQTDKGFQVRTVEDGRLVHTLKTKPEARIYITSGEAYKDMLEFLENRERYLADRRRKKFSNNQGDDNNVTGVMSDILGMFKA